ncbi:MAG: tRNA (adenosine(37)-N6)-threonylcarbamoyltransferase complex ATPase subunit type 1 TsaE [Oscillospiraceae bacterium]
MDIRVFYSDSPEETRNIAFELAKSFKAGDVVLYEGDLGAGKTAFTKGIARSLDVEETVTSPTFAIVNEYEGRMPLFHFDLYRLENFDDLYSIGFFDYLVRGGIIAAEWSENIPDLAADLDDGKRTIYTVRIDKTGEKSRKISISAQGKDA